MEMDRFKSFGSRSRMSRRSIAGALDNLNQATDGEAVAVVTVPDVTSATEESQTDTSVGEKVTRTQTAKTRQAFLRQARIGASNQEEMLSQAVSGLLNAQAQENVVTQSSLVAYKGLTRDGVDQIDPFINPVEMRNKLGRFSLPSMISVQPVNITFNAAGTPFVGSVEIKRDDYNPAILSKSLILGGPKGDAHYWPIFGYDIAVRSFSTEVGNAIVTVGCYDTTMVASASELDSNAVLMYNHTYHLDDKDGFGKLVCALAKGDRVLKTTPFDTTLPAGEAVFFDGLTQDIRHRDCSADLSVDAINATYPNSVLVLSGVNCILTVTPLIVSRESVSRILNNLDKDSAAYVKALANLRNGENDNFKW